MKRVLLVCMGLIFAGGYIGCLPDEGGVTGAAGNNGGAGSGAAGTTGVAGTQGTAGTTGVAGTSGTAGGTGGDPQGVAGTTGGAGPQGTAGSAGGTTGDAGSGGAGGGAAGRGGAAGGASGGAGGRGGAAGTAAGGTGGSAAGTTGGLPTIPELFPTSGTQGGIAIGSLDGRLITMPCGDDNPNGTDCGGGGGYLTTAGSGTAARLQCAGTSFTADHLYHVGGQAGRMYTVTLHFYGVAEPKQYCSPNATSCAANMVMKEAGANRPANTPNGGTTPAPTPWATAPAGHTYPGSDYNTNEIRVCRTRACTANDEVAVYYLNADSREGHWTYVLNYRKPIQVVGGGAVRVRNFDRNCRQIKNCGPENTAANQCATAANARIITTSGASPAPAAGAASSGGLQQPNLDPARPPGASGQWLLIDVVSVDSMQ
jgi:hypothetical protein